jgi:hypothetical protein
MSIRPALLGAGSVVLAAAGLLAAAPASAAPLHSGDRFVAACPAPYGTVPAVGTPGNGQGRFTPGFVVGTHQVGVPYAVTTPNGSFAKAAPLPADAVVCTLLTTDGVPFGTVTVVVHGKP